MNTTQRFPRPNPRFAGATEFILIGVDAVVRGLNEGEVGLVVGGCLLVLLVIVGVVVWRRCGHKIRSLRRRLGPRNDEEGREMETFSSPQSLSISQSVP